MNSKPVAIDYFSDLLCVWAYIAQIRLDELRRQFADDVRIAMRFVSVFGSTRTRIGVRWQGRGGFEAYAEHVQQVARQFEHVELHPRAWFAATPSGSTSPHAFVKATEKVVAAGDLPSGPQEVHGGRSIIEELACQLRIAFFRDAVDISRVAAQWQIAESMSLPAEQIARYLEDGSALAALAEDREAAERLQVTGSPTFVLNDGRQRLYGNVGYRVIEANVHELLRDDRECASWC